MTGVLVRARTGGGGNRTAAAISKSERPSAWAEKQKPCSAEQGFAVPRLGGGETGSKKNQRQERYGSHGERIEEETPCAWGGDASAIRLAAVAGRRERSVCPRFSCPRFPPGVRLRTINRIWAERSEAPQAQTPTTEEIIQWFVGQFAEGSSNP